eukprot:tig00020710_g13242.t1
MGSQLAERHYLEKVFSMQHHMTGDDGRPDARFYDLGDPLDEKVRNLDEEGLLEFIYVKEGERESLIGPARG